MQYGFTRFIYILHIIVIYCFITLCDGQKSIIQNCSTKRVLESKTKTTVERAINNTSINPYSFYNLLKELKIKRSAKRSKLYKNPIKSRKIITHQRSANKSNDEFLKKSYQAKKILRAPKKKTKIIFHGPDGFFLQNVRTTTKTTVQLEGEEENDFEVNREEQDEVKNLSDDNEEDEFEEEKDYTEASNNQKVYSTETTKEVTTELIEKLLDDIEKLIDKFEETSSRLLATKNKNFHKTNSLKNLLRCGKNEISSPKTIKPQNNVKVLDKSSEWSLWSEWSQCSVTCGHGVRMRSRFKFTKHIPAEVQEIQEKKCVMPDCPPFNFARLISKMFTG